jgi:hypothetical protein
MAKVLGIQKTNFQGNYLVTLDGLGAAVVKGDPQSVALLISLLINPPVPGFILLENGDFLLQENGDKLAK